MQKIMLKLSLTVLLLLGAAACSGHDERPQTRQDAKVPEMEFETSEPVKGKLNVYSSMARAVKYNTANTAQNMHKTIFNENHNQKPREVIRMMLESHDGLENRLYSAARVLDYAVLYAASQVKEPGRTTLDNIYSKTAQQLSLGAIKAHKNALFALKKIKEIDRVAARERRALASINARQERNGVLSEEDLENKKGLEVFLLKSEKLKKALQMDVKDYRDLIRVDQDVKLSLEGRPFYELEDFDKKNVLDTFQTAAVDNRRELDGARRNSRMYRAPKVKQAAIQAYPEIERLNVNGYGPKDKIYTDSLYNRAVTIAENLSDAVMAYKNIDGEKEPLKKKSAETKVYDNLGIAILAQAEIDYNLVKSVDADCALTEKEIRGVKKELDTLAKKRRLNAADNVRRLNTNLKLIELEVRLSQIKAERAVALRGLYFHSGLSPFSKTVLNADLKDIESDLKVSFNRDMVEMLAKAKQNDENDKSAGNVWAKKDNWLEELVDGSNEPEPQVSVVPAKAAGEFEPYTESRFDKATVMQLGSYRQKENADLEWNMLKELYPQLAAYTPKIETVKVRGVDMYRLILTSAAGGFKDLCNSLRQARVECLLR